METGTNLDVLTKILEDLRSSDLKIGEKFKKLNEFVKHASSLRFEDIKELINPVDFFSRRICIHTACALKNLDYIIHLWKTEETSVLRRALKKNAWLYNNDTVLADPDFLLNELFPIISFDSRQIIISKLPKYLKDEERCATIYEAVAKTYGFKNTGNLIVGCSSAYILKVTQENEITLTKKQLKLLLRKDPNLVQEYLTYFYKSKHVRVRNNYSYHSIFQTIARSHPAILIKLVESSHEAVFGLRLNPEVTRRFLRFGKSKILANPSKYVMFLDQEEVYKQLTTDEYVSLFAAEWPATIQKLQTQCYWSTAWLKHIPSSKAKGELLQKGFEIKYGVSILEDEKCYSMESIQNLLPAEIRTKVAEAKLLKSQEETTPITAQALASMTAFKSTDKSIPEIKELISHESDLNKRFELITCLLDTCVINEDKAALTEAFKHYVARHRNERDHLHVKFLARALELFDPSEFNSENWTAFIGIIQLILLTKGDSSYYQAEFCKIIEHLYIFKTLNPTEEASIKCNEMLLRLLRRKISGTRAETNQGWKIENIRRRGLNLKGFIEIVIQELESMYPKNETEPGSTAHQNMEERIYPLLSCFGDWNKSKLTKHQHPISVKDFPWLEEKVDNFLENRKNYLDPIIDLLILDPVLKKDELALEKYLKISAPTPLLIHFLRKNPKLLTDNWPETIETRLISRLDSLKFVELLKYNGYAELSKKLIQKCKSGLQESNGYTKFLVQPIAILSILLDSSDFLEMVKRFVPVTSTNKEDVYKTCNRSQIISYLKNLEFPSDAFPMLLKFCTGDIYYLRLATVPLYSLSCKAEQGKVKEFLTKLTQGSAQTKKHGILLICRFSTEQVVHDFLNTWSRTEKEGLIRCVILKILFKTETMTLWPAIRSIILTLGEKETALLYMLADYSNIDRIPTEFLEEYFTIILKMLKSFDNNEFDFRHRHYYPDFLKKIDRYKNHLSTKFMKTYFESHLFLPELSSTVTDQFVEYLLSSPYLGQNLEILRNGLANLHNPNWDITKIENGIETIQKNRKWLNYLVYALGRVVLNKPNLPYPAERLFHGILDISTFKFYKSQTFEEYLGLQFLIVFYVATRDQDYETGGKELIRIMDTYIQEYGKEVITIFKTILYSYLSYVLHYGSSSQDVIRINLVVGILDSKTSNSKEQILLALDLLSRDPDLEGHPDVQVKLKRVVDTIFNSSDPIIQLYALNWIKNFCSYGTEQHYDHEWAKSAYEDVASSRFPLYSFDS